MHATLGLAQDAQPFILQQIKDSLTFALQFLGAQILRQSTLVMPRDALPCTMLHCVGLVLFVMRSWSVKTSWKAKRRTRMERQRYTMQTTKSAIGCENIGSCDEVLRISVPCNSSAPLTAALR